MCGIMDGNVFRIAGRIGGVFLFMGGPGDHTRAQCEAVASDGAARIGTICVVGVREGNGANGVRAT